MSTTSRYRLPQMLWGYSPLSRLARTAGSIGPASYRAILPRRANPPRTSDQLDERSVDWGDRAAARRSRIDSGRGDRLSMISGATRRGPAESGPRLDPIDVSSAALPPEVRAVLEPVDPSAREAGWDAFVARYSRLFVYMARRVMPDRDGAMDAYTYVLEQLRRDEFRALRAYVTDPRSRFSTWVAVVARRTCVDFYRQQYGRPRGEGNARHVHAARTARHNLLHLTGWTTELSQLAASRAASPDRQVRSAELYQALDSARATLSAEDRLLLQLRFDEDLSAAAIAPILGMRSPFHVYRRIKSVCDELRRRLNARGIEGSAP